MPLRETEEQTMTNKARRLRMIPLFEIAPASSRTFCEELARSAFSALPLRLRKMQAPPARDHDRPPQQDASSVYRNRGTSRPSKAAASSQRRFDASAAILKCSPCQTRVLRSETGSRQPATLPPEVQPNAGTQPPRLQLVAESGSALMYPCPSPSCTSPRQNRRNRHDEQVSSAREHSYADTTDATRRGREYDCRWTDRK